MEPVRDLLKRVHAKTVFGKYPFSDKKFEKQAEAVLAKPLHMVSLVADLDGKIIGFAWATAGEHLISEEGVLTTCHVIAVEPDAAGGGKAAKPAMGDMTRRATTFLRLLKGIKAWSRTRGSEHVILHVTTGNVDSGLDAERTGRLLKKIGAQRLGGGYLV